MNGIRYLAGWAKNEIPPDLRIAFETDLIWRWFPIGDSDWVYGYKYVLSISIPKPNTWTRHPFNRPDLVMIDGGKGQLNAALKALIDLNLDQEITICSLAKKNEEIYLPGLKKPLESDINQKGVLLLRRVRDEAHRFALSFHRNKRSKNMKRSQLSEIPGVGSTRIRDLLEHFKSIDAIRIASVKELSNVKGLGKNTAEEIFKYFHEI